mmetsp:Transcript_16294/g.25025  ORF Transcript_16294/g.25025 Transcript_16294/m.25025 type:complete len:326 (-) Transcript_16294:110-1087(-)
MCAYLIQRFRTVHVLTEFRIIHSSLFLCFVLHHLPMFTALFVCSSLSFTILFGHFILAFQVRKFAWFTIQLFRRHGIGGADRKRQCFLQVHGFGVGFHSNVLFHDRGLWFVMEANQLIKLIKQRRFQSTYELIFLLQFHIFARHKVLVILGLLFALNLLQIFALIQLGQTHRGFGVLNLDEFTSRHFGCIYKIALPFDIIKIITLDASNQQCLNLLIEFIRNRRFQFIAVIKIDIRRKQRILLAMNIWMQKFVVTHFALQLPRTRLHICLFQLLDALSNSTLFKLKLGQVLLRHFLLQLLFVLHDFSLLVLLGLLDTTLFVGEFG